MPSSGVTISVTAETNAGGRKHMEDYIAVNLSPNEKLKAIPDMREQAFVGVFDGHGGKEAAKYAREKLWETIQSQDKFQTLKVEEVKEAIRDAYIELHHVMLSQRSSWQPNKTGDLSTAGTTASTVIFRKSHIFVANVGDSTAVMGVTNPRYGEPSEPRIIAQVLTKDHKPEDPEEQEHIKHLGGQVALSPKGIMRVVWERQRSGKDEVDYVPFLSVARSLGDFWSYNPRTEQFAVSPVPDVMAHPLDLSMQKFVVVASDGLWNVMTPAEVVEFVEEYRSEEQRETLHKPNDVVSALIHEALDRWERKRLPADNIAILIAFLSREADASPTNISSIMASSDATASVATSTSNASSSEDHTHHSPTPVLTETEVPTTVTPAVPPSLPVPKPRNSAYHSEVWPEGVSVEYQTKMKLRHRRKHKHGRRHRRDHPNTVMSPTKHVTISPTSATSVVLSSAGNIVTDDHETVLDVVKDPSIIPLVEPEFSMFGTENGQKRKLSSDEDEGVSLVPVQKRPHVTEEEGMCLSKEELLSLRSERLSTDANSDSGSSSTSNSSGICSDMDCPEETSRLYNKLHVPGRDMAELMEDGLEKSLQLPASVI